MSKSHTKKDTGTVVGFDLGHGETAVSWADVDKTNAPNVLDLPGATGRQHVTAVATMPSGQVLIGEEAVWTRGASALHLAFKAPHIDRPEVRTPIELFVTKVREDLRAGAMIPETGPAMWVFGAPSGWDRPLTDRYAELLTATGIPEVRVVPESRAALLYARDAGEVKADVGGLLGTVLIVDVGSSTTDFTAVVSRRQRPFDYGTRLGAGLIDKEILRRVVESHPDRERLAAILDDGTERLRLELRCRRAKEEFFRTDPHRFVVDPRAGILLTHPVEDSRGRLYINHELTPGDMEAVIDAPQPVLEGRSWREAFRLDLEMAAEAIGTLPDVVLLTGGASRMRFVQEETRALFGAERVLLGSEPEAAIARGLALAGRTSRWAEGFRADVDRLIHGDQIRTLVTDKLPALAQELGRAAADGITERHIIPAVKRWRAGKIDTINELAAKVAAGIHAELTAPDNPTVLKVVADWQNKLLPDIGELTRPVCERWHVPPSSMALAPVSVSGKDWGKVAVPRPGATTDLLEGIAAVAGVVVAGVLAATLFGSGVAIIAATGPLGVFIAFVAGIMALTMGWDAAKEKVMDADLPAWVREMRSERKMIEKVREKASAQEAELARQLGGQFAKDGRTDLIEQFTRLLTAELERLAEEAELLVS